MPGFIAASQSRPIENFILRDVTSQGRVIGSFSGKPTTEAIIDAFGRPYVFSGVASRTRSGKFDVECLGAGEFILSPGLVYRFVAKKKTPWSLASRVAIDAQASPLRTLITRLARGMNHG